MNFNLTAMMDMMELKGDPLYDSAAAMLSSAGQDVTSGPYIVKFRLKPID